MECAETGEGRMDSYPSLAVVDSRVKADHHHCRGHQQQPPKNYQILALTACEFLALEADRPPVYIRHVILTSSCCGFHPAGFWPREAPARTGCAGHRGKRSGSSARAPASPLSFPANLCESRAGSGWSPEDPSGLT